MFVLDRGPAGILRERSDHAAQAVDRVRRPVLRAGEALGDPAHRIVVGLERELLLGAEMVVDPALLEPGGADEVAERRADEPLAVEDGRRQLDDALAGALALGRRADHGCSPRPLVASL